MATVNLGRIKPVFRGAYSGSTAYVIDDIVTHGNESFICIQAHGAGTQATSVTAYWTKLAAKGTDGTDVGTTITTQGDILYRDGSGLQRLAKPASDMYLKNTSGGVVSWSAISSEMVKLGSTAFTSGTPSEVNLDVTFDDSTYYKYQLHGFLTTDSTKDANLSIRVRQGGTTKSDSSYDYIQNYAYRKLSNNNQSNSYGAAEDAAFFRVYDWSFYAEDYPINFKIECMADMETTDRYKAFGTEAWGYRHHDGDYMQTKHTGFAGYEGNNDPITGINILKTAGNFKTGHLAWYGFKR